MSHLRVKGTRYAFRRKVPVDLAGRFGRKELVRLLPPCDYRNACAEARRLAVHTDRLFEMVRRNTALTDAQIAETARFWYGEKVSELVESWFEKATGEPETYEAEAVRAEKQADDAQALLSDGRVWPEAEAIAEDLLRRRGLAVAKDDPAFAVLCQDLTRGFVEASRWYAAKFSNHTTAVVDPQFLFPTPATEAATQVVAPTQSVTVPHVAAAAMPAPPAVSGPALAELIGKHQAAMKTAWTGQTASQNAATFRMFSDRFGERPVTTVSRRDVSDWLMDLGKMPAKWGQDRRYRDKTFGQMVKLAEGERSETPRLTQKTINRHISAISGLFTWAKKHGYFEGANPAEGFIDKRSDGTGPKRRPWRADELQKLFRTPLWAGCQSESRRLEAGSEIIRDWKFWMPLLALYGGVRLEEACKLRDEDFRQTGGIWVIDIVGSKASGRVKEEASNRTVPVHPMLIQIGILKHVESVRTAGGGSLWPDLARGGIDGKFSHNATKFFTRYFTEMGLKTAGLTFHSFRRNFASALHGAGVPESTAADLMGHQHKSMSFRVYSEGAAVLPLFDAVKKVMYAVDLSTLKG